MVTRENVIDTVAHPEHTDNESDLPKLIASKSIDSKHVLRVVYKVENNGIIKVVTFYPAEKGRYY